MKKLGVILGSLLICANAFGAVQTDSLKLKDAEGEIATVSGSFAANRAITVPDAAGTIALTANKLSAFAATTSAELSGVLSDEDGSGTCGTGAYCTGGHTHPTTELSGVNAGTDLTADLEEEVTEGSLADSTIVSADIKDATIAGGDLAANIAITSTGSQDYGGGSFEVPNSASLPGTCTVGQVYMDTDATSGQRMYSCESSNTWALQGDGGAGGGDSISIDTSAVVDPNFASTGQIDFVNNSNTVTGDINADAIVESDLKAVDASSDEDVFTYESTTGDFEWHSRDEIVGGITAGALPNDNILEADLKAVDAASDEECLTYETTTGDFEWQACGSGTGSTALNLPIYSAKLTGAFTVFTPPTADACTAGAQIDAGDGNWRLLFDATTDECATWQFIVPDNYSSTPTLNIKYSMVSATANEVEFEGAIMCVTPGDAADIGTASFSNVAVASDTVPGTAGYLDTATISLTDDSCAAGDIAFVVLSKDADDATADDATGDTELIGLEFNYA